MKNFLLLICMALFVSASAQNNDETDKSDIKNVIQTFYVDGLQNLKNVDKIADGFHPGFNLLMLRGNGMMDKRPIYNWIKYVKQKKANQTEPLKEDQRTTVKFLDIDITGTAAVAKIELRKGGKPIYVDYLSLYKFPEGWKIVGKIYYKVAE